MLRITKPLLLMTALALLAPAAALFAPAAALAQARDVAGSKDFPGIGRFAGSAISGHQVKNFDVARMQAAPFKDGQPSNTPRIEGRITRIAYRTPAGPSIVEVSRNFETQLAKAGFETLLDCETEACGGIPFTEAIEALPIPQMWVDGFNYHYYAGKKTENGRETYGDSMIVDPWGHVIARVTEPGPGLAVAQIDRTLQQELRGRFPALEHRKIDVHYH